MATVWGFDSVRLAVGKWLGFHWRICERVQYRTVRHGTHVALLETLWEVATYARYAEEEGLAAGGGSLTPLQGQKARLKYPPPRNIGGAGTGD